MNSLSQKSIPESIVNEAKTALSFYPELHDVSIAFKFKKKIKKSTMQAQPVFTSLFSSKRKRKYVILISEKFKIGDTAFLTKDIPKEVMIGWLGHELGHIMDYRNRTGFGLIWFGVKYLCSGSSIRSAERAADTYAFKSGMKDYILTTKNFILNQAGIPERYKNRIKKLYLSPEEIMEMVGEQGGSDPQ